MPTIRRAYDFFLPSLVSPLSTRSAVHIDPGHALHCPGLPECPPRFGEGRGTSRVNSRIEPERLPSNLSSSVPTMQEFMALFLLSPVNEFRLFSMSPEDDAIPYCRFKPSKKRLTHLSNLTNFGNLRRSSL